MSVDSFVSSYEGHYVDVDGVPRGALYQCVDLFNLFHQKVVGGSYVRMAFSGGAKDLWRTDNNAQVNTLYIRIDKSSAARKGDVAVWGGYSDGYSITDYGHVAMVLSNTGSRPSSIATFTQNPGPATRKSLSTAGLLGFLRPKIFAVFNTVAPAIAGTARLGSTLTANAGSWSVPSLTYRYQWLANGSAISGATSSRFVPTAAQVGKRLQVRVTASRSGYNTVDATSASTSTVAAGALANLTKPVINGDPVVDGTLTVVSGTWTPAPDTTTYQWFANGAPIVGATSPQLVLGPAQEGMTVAVRQTAVKAGYTASTVESSATAPVGGAQQLQPGTPTISGTAELDSALTVDPGTWGPSPVALTFQWNRNGGPVVGATGPTYPLADADVGARISVTVTGRKAGFATASRTSAETPPVAAGGLTAAVPTIQGDVVVGSILTVLPGTWRPDGVSLSFQWLRDGTPVGAATESTYTVSATDVGHRLAVAVTGRLGGYRAASVTSAPTERVEPLTLTSATPVISGAAKQGQRLTASTPGWSPGTAFAYQWKRDGSTVSGATGSTYTPGESDLGRKISVTVTGSLPGYAAVTRASASTAAVGSMRGDTLTADSSLANGEALYSSDFKYKAVQQTDGNFVVYNRSTARAVWSSGTAGKGAVKLRMQSDGNLVQYTSSGKAVWATGTNGKGAVKLRMQSDGNLVLYTSSGSAVWATDTVGR